MKRLELFPLLMVNKKSKLTVYVHIIKKKKDLRREGKILADWTGGRTGIKGSIRGPRRPKNIFLDLDN